MNLNITISFREFIFSHDKEYFRIKKPNDLNLHAPNEIIKNIVYLITYNKLRFNYSNYNWSNYCQILDLIEINK